MGRVEEDPAWVLHASLPMKDQWLVDVLETKAGSPRVLPASRWDDTWDDTLTRVVRQNAKLFPRFREELSNTA